MKTGSHRLLPIQFALGAALLAGCNAQGGDGLGGGGPGGGLVPGTPVARFTCTQFAPPGSVVTTSEGGVLCTLTDPLQPLLNTCDVTDPGNAADNNAASAATVQFAASALDPALDGFVTLAVDLPGPVGAGRVAAFLIEAPGDIVDVSVLRNLDVSTFLNGTQQETTTGGAALIVNLLGLAGSGPELVGFVNTQAYNRIELRVATTMATAALLDALRVAEVCTNAVPAP